MQALRLLIQIELGSRHNSKSLSDMTESHAVWLTNSLSEYIPFS
jgi:hypothetical protein